jgi:uncharacterized protein (DUF736 family)
MATIGVFSLHQDRYYGSIHTLTLNTRAEIIPSEMTGEKSPRHLVMIGDVQIGAGWERSSRDGGKYISIKLDDPRRGAAAAGGVKRRAPAGNGGRPSPRPQKPGHADQRVFNERNQPII